MSTLSDNDKRIKCAEILGWKWYRRPATGPWADKPYRALYHPVIVPEYTSTLTEADMTERQCNEVFIWREGMIPDYLTDANAALELMEWMRGKGFGSSCNLMQSDWQVCFTIWRDDEDQSIFCSTQPTFCQAIVDAFLKANGVEL